MKKLISTSFAILLFTGLSAQIPLNYTATDCNNVTKNIHTTIGTTGKSVIVMSKGTDCSACRFSAASWQSWASQNTAKVEVWGAMTYRYNPMLFNNPCSTINAWTTQYSWTDVYAFNDTSRSFLGPAMPRYYVYSAIDSTIIYNGPNSTTARNLAVQNSVVGIEELNALKAVDIRVIDQQLVIRKQDNDLVQLKIVDLQGRMIEDISFYHNQTTVDFNGLSKGLYIVNLQNDGASYSTKILIP